MKKIKLTPMESASGKCMQGVAGHYLHDGLNLVIVAANKKQLREAWAKITDQPLIDRLTGKVAIFSKNDLKPKAQSSNASSTS